MPYIPTRCMGLLPIDPSPGGTLRANLLTYLSIFTARPCTSAFETCDEIEGRKCGGPIVDGRTGRRFARQNSGDVTLWASHLSLAGYACFPFSSLRGFVWFRY
eukprot:1124098-Pleurochrysis_carterae.AAC.1